MLKKYLIPIVALAGLGFAAVIASQRGRSDPPPLQPPVAAAQSPYATFVAAPGLTEPSTDNIAIGAPSGGIVTKIHVVAGNPVKTGDLLFELDDRSQRAELIKQRAELQATEARTRTAIVSLDNARQQLRFVENITDSRAVSSEVLANRRSAVAVAEARLAEAESDVASVQAQIKATEIELDRLRVRAPVDGQILQVRTRVGEFASAGVLDTPLMVLGNVEYLHVRTDVDEDNAWRIRAGTAATAHLRGNKDIHTALEFVRFEPYIIPKRSLTGAATERVDTRVLQVIYRFKRDSLPIFVGQQMDVFIEAADTTPTTNAKGGA